MILDLCHRMPGVVTIGGIVAGTEADRESVPNLEAGADRVSLVLVIGADLGSVAVLEIEIEVTRGIASGMAYHRNAQSALHLEAEVRHHQDTSAIEVAVHPRHGTSAIEVAVRHHQGTCAIEAEVRRRRSVPTGTVFGVDLRGRRNDRR